MRELVEYLKQKNKIYKKIEVIEPKSIGIRNKIGIYHCTDVKGYYTLIIKITQKSRVLQKDVPKYETIFDKCVSYLDHNCKYKLLIIESPLCSKAKLAFKESGWKIL